MNGAPMSEFWVRSWTHRVKDEDRFFVKQPASAAHATGKRLVLAEGFTTIGPHWQETLWDNLKPSFGRALTEGVNRPVWHTCVCSQEREGVPGQQYFAETHLKPNVTWWNRSGPFFAYLNLCQAMLQRGLLVAEVFVYYGDNVPRIAQLRASDPGRVGKGCDHDVISANALLLRAKAKDGRIVMPDGMSYRVLVLPDQPAIALPVLRKAQELARAGARVVGPAYKHAEGLRGDDAAVRRLVAAMGLTVKTGRTALFEAGVVPGFEADASLDRVHRRDGATEIYFVSNTRGEAAAVRATFRVGGKAPEIWDPVTGERRLARAYVAEGNRTEVPLERSAYGSAFVVFQRPIGPPSGTTNAEAYRDIWTLDGPWTVASIQDGAVPHRSCSTGWRIGRGGPSRVSATTWEPPCTARRSTFRRDSGVRGFRWTWDWFGRSRPFVLTARSWEPCGAPPFRVELGNAVRPTGNVLEVEVVNFWPNRIIGDAARG